MKLQRVRFLSNPILKFLWNSLEQTLGNASSSLQGQHTTLDGAFRPHSARSIDLKAYPSGANFGRLARSRAALQVLVSGY